MKKLLIFAILLSIFLIVSQANAAFFLRGTGPENNPPVIFLDNIAPTSETAKYRDSASVKFAEGNQWKDIGTWSVTTTGILTEAYDLHVWLGLKNSDDIGTRFDLRAEIYNNDTLITEGDIYCITGITRNPSLAKEVALSFASFSPVYFHGGDILSIRILTRIGTNGSGAFCGGHSNAVGLRLYFDAISRPSNFNTTILENSPPVANAGQDQQVRVGDLVTLDGRQSYDPDGDLITYNWIIMEAPPGSSTALSNPASVMPTFIPDIPGDYIIALTVNDGELDSIPDDVIVIAAQPNAAPTANAGSDQSVITGNYVYLDGMGSFDPDGDPLTYQWQIISLPEGSIAFLNDPTSPTPNFLPDQDGQYIIQLRVNDGWLDSLPDDMVVTSVTPNAPPVAYAGEDRTVSKNWVIGLDGTGSSDPENAPLIYNWSIVSRPEGSSSELNDPTFPTPSFLADREGEYVFRLVVYDGDLFSSPDTVVVTVVNDPPNANAGPDTNGTVGVPVALDGSGSSDPNGDILSYQWSMESAPTGSTAAISNPSSATPSFTPDLPGTYTIQLIVHDGWLSSAPDTVRIEVMNPNQNPIANPGGPYAGVVGTPVQFNGSGSSDPDGDPITYSWDFGDGSTGSGINATHTYSNTGTYTITLRVDDNRGGSNSAQTTANIVNPQPEGSFGEQYQDLIPPDATITSYDPKRFSLITGLARNLGGSPIGDVLVNILGHPEYGTAKTNAEGRFSIPVEGGGTLTVTYKKEGLITTHRKVYVPWNDIAISETIEMIPEDTLSTTLSFNGNPNTVIAHQSTIVIDDRGSRSSAIVFTGDNHAYSVDASGQIIQELTTITVRATEFTTPDSMPAKLPPNSAYTYCVELSVDGVPKVKFDKPVIVWVDNFLGFNVGERVPVGYYDRDRGVWVPSDDGLVVRLLDTNSDGIVDALDSNGDGQPDDLNNNGSFGDEVLGLSNPQRYSSGSTFWRVAVIHFTPWDLNWLGGPPLDAISPNPQGMPDADQQEIEGADCKKNFSSFIEERSRIFHEDISIPGTDITLHYASNRVKGFQYKITVPASGETIPPSLKRIIVRLEVAGRAFEQILSPLPNQKGEFIWDNLDFLGNTVSGLVVANVRIGFVYDAFYYSAGDFAQSFAQVGSQVTGIKAREEIISWKQSDIHIYIAYEKEHIIAEGWTIFIHHYFSPLEPSTLHKGDGTTIKNQTPIIGSVSQIIGVYDVAVDAKGNIYIAEPYWNRIWKMDTNGVITVVAGSANGYVGYKGDGGPATEAWLRFPEGVAVDASGNLYIADSGNNRIRKVDSNGIITTVVGNGIFGYSGDGGPATEARISFPKGVALDVSGNLYFSQVYYPYIRKVDPGGIITTIAGNGTDGYGGDGGPATEAIVSYPYGIAVDAIGNIYIADAGNNRIRRVDTSGIITTVVGNGEAGYAGDGWLATQAKINNPLHLTFDASNNLYFSDQWNNRIRKVDTSGVITTVAGNGLRGNQVDGVPAIETIVDWPVGVALDAGGNLYIGELGSGGNPRVRKVVLSPGFSTFPQSGEITFGEKSGLGYTLSSDRRHNSTIDLDTGRTLYTFGYDQNNNLVSITDQFGNITTIERNASGVPTAIISPDGIITTLTIDSNNHLIQISYPDANFYAFEYTPNGLMTAKTEPEGNRFEHVFNSIGRLTDAMDQEEGHWQYSRSVNPNGNIQIEVLSAEGNLTTYLDHTDSTGAYTSHITDPAGAETLYTRSADKLTATKSLPCGMNLTFKYGVDSKYKFQFLREMREKTTSGLERITLREKTYQDTNADAIPDLITERITLNGKLTTFVTNTLLSKKILTSPVGRATTTFFDPNTILTTKLRIPGLYDTDFLYDTRGRLTSINTDIRQTTFTYDTQGNLSSITDPENRITTYSYDALGRMTDILRPDSSSIGFSYDENGNTTLLTNPSTINHGFAYNRVNLNSSYQTPLSGSYSYVYNKDKQLTQINFPSSRQIINVYDKDRVIQTQTPEGNIDFTYLCGSKIGSITKGTESITYGYDGSLVASETLSGTLNQSLSYSYNNDFNLMSFTYAGGTVNHTYDNDGLLTGAGAFTITRNAGNGLPEAVTGGVFNLTRTFNGYGEIEGENSIANSQSLNSWNLVRDKTGRITAKTETVQGTTSNYAYTYDSLGRLLTVTKNGTLIEEYQYDSIGRRTYEMNMPKGITGRSLTYSDEDHLLTAGDISYQYNVDGFLTNKTHGVDVAAYNYSSRGELLNVNLPDGTVIEYINDPLGRRIAKKVSGVVVEKYLWQGLNQLLSVYDGSDNLIMRFEYSDERMPLSMIKGGITYYLTYDQVGSLRIVADASGNVVKRIDYDSFGNITNDTNPVFVIPFGFAGGLHDQDTGLVRFGFRDYDPSTGRWTAKDPIGFAGGDVDLYGDVGNNPVNFVDPLGLWTYGLGVTVNVGAGFGGGGGTFINIGYNPNSSWLSGWSFSITGVAGGGAIGGAGYGLSISTTITNACDTKQLLGPFFEVGRGGLGRAGLTYIQSPDGTVQGVNVTARIRGKGYIGASVGGSTSSALIQWTQGQGFSFGVTPTGSIIP